MPIYTTVVMKQLSDGNISAGNAHVCRMASTDQGANSLNAAIGKVCILQ